MRDTIYLAVGRNGVRTMTKRHLPKLSRGEIPVKLILEVDFGAFREPVIEQRIKITDWRQGIDLPDVKLGEMFITEAEAETIRQQRVAAMIGILGDQGYTVTPAEATGAPQA